MEKIYLPTMKPPHPSSIVDVSPFGRILLEAITNPILENLQEMNSALRTTENESSSIQKQYLNENQEIILENDGNKEEILLENNVQNDSTSSSFVCFNLNKKIQKKVLETQLLTSAGNEKAIKNIHKQEINKKTGFITANEMIQGAGIKNFDEVKKRTGKKLLDFKYKLKNKENKKESTVDNSKLFQDKTEENLLQINQQFTNKPMGNNSLQKNSDKQLPKTFLTGNLPKRVFKWNPVPKKRNYKTDDYSLLNNTSVFKFGAEKAFKKPMRQMLLDKNYFNPTINAVMMHRKKLQNPNRKITEFFGACQRFHSPAPKNLPRSHSEDMFT